MDESKPCSLPDDTAAAPRLLSHGSVGHVALCGCGHLHLSLKYLTLRFEPEAFRELTALLAFAQRSLDAPTRQRTANDAAPPDGNGPVH